MDVRRHIRVGVTGGIGSGKTTVCRMLTMLGAALYDTDARAKELMRTDLELVASIKQRFGEAVYKNGVLDNACLAQLVFNDRSALEDLNGLVHPAVRCDFQKWVETQQSGDAPYVLLESAILFESGFRDEVDCVVAVSAPVELRIARAMARDNAPREKIEARVANQMTDAQREKLSDYVVVTDDVMPVWEQVLELDVRLRRLAEERCL